MAYQSDRKGIPVAYGHLRRGQLIGSIPNVTMSGEKVRQAKTAQPKMAAPPMKCGKVATEFSEVARRAKLPIKGDNGSAGKGRPVTTKS